jgi:hypothetical protein
MNHSCTLESTTVNGPARAGSSLVASSSIVDLVMIGGVLVCLAIFGSYQVCLAGEDAEVARTADFLCDLHRAQRQHFEDRGEYATSIRDLDLRLSTPVFFDIRPIEITKDGWTAQAVRTGPGRRVHSRRLSIDQVGMVRSIDENAFVTTPIGSVPTRTQR